MNKPSEDGVRCVDCGDRISTPWYARARARFLLAVQAYERHMNNEKAVLELKTELARVIRSRESIFRKSVGFHQQMLAAQHELAVQKATSNIALDAIMLGKLGLIERLVGPMEQGGVGHTDHDDATGKCLTCEIRKVLSGND